MLFVLVGRKSVKHENHYLPHQSFDSYCTCKQTLPSSNGHCTIRQRVFDCNYLSCRICFNVLNCVFIIGHRRCAYYIFQRWGFFFFFFFQSPSRLNLTSDCHNQYLYRKVVEVAVIWNMTRLKILPMWGVSPQNVPKIEQTNDPQAGKTARIQILSNFSES